MNAIVVYYSFTGNTKLLAEAKAEELGAPICQVVDKKKPGALKSFLLCPKAMRMSPTPVLPISANLAAFDTIIIMAPVWAGHPAPAAINIFNALPAGKEVEVYLVSASGKTNIRQKIEANVASCGCTLTKLENIGKK